MNHNLPAKDETTDAYSSAVTADTYDAETAEGGWDSPERAQALVEPYIDSSTLVLDIGTGTGQAAKGYMDKGAMVVALDRDAAMLEEAKQTIGENGVYRTADINAKLPVEDIEGLVDVAQAVGVLEFAEDFRDVVGQVGDSLAPGGKFVFTVEEPGVDGKLTEYYSEIDITTYRHPADEVLQVLDQKGFRLLHDESYGGYERGTEGEKVPYHIYLAEKVTQQDVKPSKAEAQE